MAKIKINNIILRSPLLSKEQKKSLLESLDTRTENQLIKLTDILLNSEAEFFKMYSKAGGNSNAINTFVSNKNIYLESFNG